MANSSATRMVHIATVRSTPKEDKEPAVVYVNEFETQIKLFESQMAAAGSMPFCVERPCLISLMPG